MHTANKDITSAISLNLWHPIINKLYSLNCWYYFVVHKKSCSQLMVFVFLTVPPLSHLTSCTLTKSNLYFADFLETVVNDSDLYKLLTFHVLNVMHLFHCLGCTKGSAQDRGKWISFVTRSVFTVRSCQHLAQLPSWRTVPCWLSGHLVQYIRC
jgi:hypothetical protein